MAQDLTDNIDSGNGFVPSGNEPLPWFNVDQAPWRDIFSVLFLSFVDSSELSLCMCWYKKTENEDARYCTLFQQTSSI